MARPLRIEYPGAVYHVTRLRGMSQPERQGGMRKVHPSKLRCNEVGYASAGFAEAVKIFHEGVRGASPPGAMKKPREWIAG